MNKQQRGRESLICRKCLPAPASVKNKDSRPLYPLNTVDNPAALLTEEGDMAYISNCVTHWAGRALASNDDRYDLLVNRIIARRELLFSECPWDFCSKYGGVNNFCVPVVSFTDIPLSNVEQHCHRYSRFGISLSKNYLTNCLASPVAYVLNPFVFEAYSCLRHSLEGLRPLVDGQVLPEGRRKGKKCDINQMCQWLQALAFFYQNYDKQEYVFNEMQAHPHEDQETYFERADALYYEREWRLIERHGSRFPWDVYRDGQHFFHFEAQYVKFIIMPRTYAARFTATTRDCLKDYPPPQPAVLAFEDLRYF